MTSTFAARRIPRFHCHSVVLSFVVLLSACATVPLEEVAPLPAEEPRLGWSIALEPVVAGGSSAAAASPEAEAEIAERFAASLDPARLNEAAGAGLSAVFASVVTVSVPGGAGQARELYVDAAGKAKSDYLFSLSVDRYDLSFVGANRRWWGNWFLTGLFMFPGWWVADETYRAELDVSLDVTAVATGAVLDRRSFKVSQDWDIDERTKGMTTTGTIFNATGGLSAQAWRDLEKNFRSVLLGKVRNELMTYRPPPLPAKAAGVCIGIASHKLQGAVPDVEGADKDATALREHLLALGAQAGLPPFLPQNLRLLPNGAANRGQLLGQFEDLADRVKAEDSVLIYFAGRTAIAGAERYLVPWDFDPARPAETGVTLAELREKLGKIKSRSLVLVLDTAFDAPDETGRTLRIAQPVPAPEPDAAPEPEPEPADAAPFDPSQLLPPAPGRAVYVAASAGEGALTRKGRGLFTTRLLEGVGWSWENNAPTEARADLDGDARVDWPELKRYVGQGLRDLLDPLGRAQTPVLSPAEPPGETWLSPRE